MDNKKMFESLEGFEYALTQLTEIPEEGRREYLFTVINILCNGYVV